MLTKFVFFQNETKQLSGKQVTILIIERNCNHNRYLRISRAPLKSQAHQGTSLFTSAERVAANDLDEDKCTSKLSNVSIFPRHDLVYLQIIQIIFLILHTTQLFRIKINYLEENLQLEVIDLKC